METTYCLACTVARVLAEAQEKLGMDVEIPEVREAFTWAPSWQEKRIGPQMVMACVALPTCYEHLEVQELSPAEQAVRNGRLLEGRPGA